MNNNLTERKPDRTAHGWDAASEEYARLFSPYTSLFAQDAVRLCSPHRSDVVLEIAAGSGALTRRLADAAKYVTATDLSPKMVECINEMTQTDHLHNVKAAVMDGQDLIFAENTFDAVYSLFGVIFFPDPNRGLTEMARVLKPGGRCLLTSWTSRSRLLAPVAAAMATMMPESQMAQALAAPGTLSEPAEFKKQLAAAGLHDVEMHEVSHPFGVSRQDYLHKFPRASPSGIQALESLQPKVKAVFGELVEAELIAEFGSGLVTLPGIANIAVSKKR